MRSTAPVWTAKISNIAMSVCLIAFGIAVIALPSMSLEIIGITTGVMMCVFGIFRLVGYFSRDLFRLAFQYDLQIGVMSVVMGIILAAEPEQTLLIICVVFGVTVFVSGLFRSAVALQARRFGIKPWYVILGAAMLSCAFGITLLAFPAASTTAAAVILGAALIAEGVSNLAVMLTAVKIVKRRQPDRSVDEIN